MHGIDFFKWISQWFGHQLNFHHATPVHINFLGPSMVLIRSSVRHEIWLPHILRNALADIDKYTLKMTAEVLSPARWICWPKPRVIPVESLINPENCPKKVLLGWILKSHNSVTVCAAALMLTPIESSYNCVCFRNLQHQFGGVVTN